MPLLRLRRTSTTTSEHDAAEEADELSAELAETFWQIYDRRMTAVRFSDIAKNFPRMVGQSLRLGWTASRLDTVACIAGNLLSGIFSGYGLFATTGVLSALFAEGPTPHRVRAALPSLALVVLAAAFRSGVSSAAGWSQARLEPRIDQAVEMRLLDLTSQVELSAFDDPDFHEHLQRARTRGVYSAAQVVNNVINWLTAFASMTAAVVVVGVLNPVLLAVLAAAQLPGAWSAVRAARIEYVTRFALSDAFRRKYVLTDQVSSRNTAAELRSFTLRRFLLDRVGRVSAYARDAELDAARRTTMTRVAASAMGGVATAGVYAALGGLLSAGALPLSAAGTAVLAIRSAGGSLAQLMNAVNQCYSEGLYFSDYLAFCADALTRVRPATGTAPPDDPERIVADGVSFAYPGTEDKALSDVSLTIARGEVVALVGENGSGKTTLAKILAGLYQPSEGSVTWDGTGLSGVDGEALRERIAVIAQDHANWPLTVRQNITMGRDLDDGLLASAVAASDAGPVIDGLARGYDTLLARQFKDGAELSGGQWQRIAAARGFYRTAPLLIMDEPTAALDARAEYALFSSLRTLAEDRTLVLITHRLASVRHADRIYVLDHGRLIESGSHEELMELAGQYSDLYTLQASQYDDG
ncbi:MAG: ABC transporter ATP-binding protein/permease [Streptosporangiales bacterium]|nr:ABC transporter ATP-binding protein/permease [Streptosporangiales bacterium]